MAFAKGQQAAIGGKYSIFTDGTKSQFSGGAGVKKSVMLNYNNDPKWGPQVSMSFKMGDDAGKAFIMTPVSAMTLAEICGKLFDKGMELDLGRVNVSYNKNDSYKRPSSPAAPAGNTEAAGSDDTDPFA